MSYAVDVNLLLYASNNADAHHPKASAFLRRCVAGPELMCLGWLTVMSYLRMTTHPKIFAKPLTHAAAATYPPAPTSCPTCISRPCCANMA